MKKRIAFVAALLMFVLPNFVLAQNTTASFTAPDSVCTNTNVHITNTSTGGTNVYWSFCETDFSTPTDATNLGNVGGQLSLPVFTDIVQDENGNYLVFLVNNYPGQLIRMNFGSSLLNSPVVDNLGDFGGAIPLSAEGIQVINANGNWTVVIVGGDPVGGVLSSIMKVDLGTSVATSSGTATNWGDLGNLYYPHDLYCFQENNKWYGYTVNALNNTLTRFDFGTNFATAPVATNLGNLASFNGPVGIGAINNLGKWYMFITNSTDGTISRLDFGASLLNNPVATNLGNPSNKLDNPRDISFILVCSGVKALVVNGNSNTIAQLDFGNNPDGSVSATTLGNPGNLDFPHSLSKLFRVDNDIYCFVPNVDNNTVTRIHFAGCATPGSTLKNPADVSYSSPGTYNINLLVDLGLPTQSSYCKKIVVSDCPALSCDKWLALPTQPAAVEIGDLDVPGTQITVEALIDRTTPYLGGTLFAGDVVSKHNTPNDGNYLLRPNEAEITTTNGYFRTPDICEIQLNKTYHVAMVYDGATLKFYRNGFLMSQTAASGTLFQNDFPTRIGYYFSQAYNTNFIGFINEVRIWNVARTQSQLRAYMNVALPSPATQAGLLAYYEFNDLINKQGNAQWNGKLVGSAAVGQTNPTCVTFVPDSCCPVLQGQLTGGDICLGSPATLTFSGSAGIAPYTLTYSDGTVTYTQTNVMNNVPFAVGAQPTTNTTYHLLTIQDASSCTATNITGLSADITVTNCSLCKGSLGDPLVNITFGSGQTAAGPLSSIVPGATTTMQFVAVNGNPATPIPTDGQYTITNNVPSNANWFAGALDHTPDDVNGYMAFYNASDQPGEFYTQTINNLCGSTSYEFAAWIANVLDPAKITGVNPNITFAIETSDGVRIKTYNTGDIVQSPTLTWKQYGFFFSTPPGISTVVIKLINNNPGGTTNVGNDLAIDDITLKPCGATIRASYSKTQISDSIAMCADGDTVIIGTVANGYAQPAYVWQKSVDSGKTWIDILNSGSLSLPVSAKDLVVSKLTMFRLTVVDAENLGSPSCRVVSNTVKALILPLPDGTITGESICIGDPAQISFATISDQGPFLIVLANGQSIVQLSSGQHVTNLPVPGTLSDTTMFTLISVKDQNGCTSTKGDTAQINVSPLPDGSITGPLTVCANDSVPLTFFGSGGVAPFNLILQIGQTLTSFSGVQSGVPFYLAPSAQDLSISIISVTDRNGNGCVKTTGFGAPLLITVNQIPELKFDALSPVCLDQNEFAVTSANEISGVAGTGVFTGSGIDHQGNFTPIAAGVGMDTITYTYTSIAGCAASIRQTILVNPTPIVDLSPDLFVCPGIDIQLHAGVAASYLWTPAVGLSNPAIGNPDVNITTTTSYKVIVTDSNGCSAADSINLIVSPLGKAAYVVPSAFTPNGDGKNDCFGVQNWGGVSSLEFSIFNRWGQPIFTTNNPMQCWNGTFHGKMQDPGTFVYMIKAITPCGKVSLKGTVILVR